MRCRTLTNTLILVLFALILVGCGQKDESPEVRETSQTTALVPGTVPDDGLGDAVGSSGIENEAVILANDHPAAEADVNPVEGTVPAGNTVVTEVDPGAGNKDEASVTPPAVVDSGRYSLQLGSFTVLAIAEEKAADLRKLGHAATIEQAEVGGQLYHRLFIRGIADRKSAENLGEELHSSLGFSYLIKRK